jgi:replicative DNA helicase
MVQNFQKFAKIQDDHEQALFAHLSANPKASAALNLEPRHFSTPTRAAIFAGLQRLSDKPFDRRTLKIEVERLGDQLDEGWWTVFDAPAGLDGQAGNFEIIEGLAGKLKELAVRHWFTGQLEANLHESYTPDLGMDIVLQRHAMMLAKAQEQLTDDIDPSVQAIRERSREVDNGHYYPSGLTEIDRAVKGLHPGHLWAITAPYKGRKTSTVLNIVAEQLRQGRSVMYIALEANDREFFDKLVAIWGDHPYHLAESGTEIADPETRAAVERTRDEVAAAKLRIYDRRKDAGNYLALPSLVASDKLRYGSLDLVVIDYLQAYSADYEDLKKVVPLILDATVKHNVATIVLSQMSNVDIRGQRGGGPGSDGLLLAKATGDLGAAVHVGLELRREPDVDDELLIHLKVARNGKGVKSFVQLNPSSGLITAQGQRAIRLSHWDDADGEAA